MPPEERRSGLRPVVRARTVPLRDGTVQIQVRTAGQGPPLVYFHSFHDRDGWSPLLDRLAARHRVYAPVHPGVGGSTGVEHLDDVVDLALVYDECLTALGLRRAHLAGHFFGAMVAAELAALLPERARRLVLISPLGLWRDDAPTADVLILPHAELMAALWQDPESAAARAWATLPGTEAENVAAQLESIARRAAMGKFVWPIPDKGLRRRLHRVAAPTLLLWGDADRVNPVAYGEAWRERLAKAELRLVPGGHMVPHESPDATAAAALEFLVRDLG
jgi:pimeloyl-ACP methyl ester carboxylesterase